MTPPARAYAILYDGGYLLAFDPRPLEAVEAEWLAKWSLSGHRVGHANLQEAKVRVKLQKSVESEFSSDDSEVEPVKSVTPAQDEILRLQGIPGLGNMGAASILAGIVRGVAYAHPGEAANWLEGLRVKEAVINAHARDQEKGREGRNRRKR